MKRTATLRTAMLTTACILPVIWAFCLMNSCYGNQMDPHVYPKEGPFFEGWYTRIIDSEHNVSVCFLFGKVLPSNSFTNTSKFSSDSAPLVYLGMLLNLDPLSKLDDPTGFFEPSQYSVTQDGRPVVHNPDDATPPHFEARIGENGENLTLIVTPDRANFSVAIGHHILHGSMSTPVPWGPNGQGPESWLEKLPLPFHWFVYSLRSDVYHYEYVNKETGETFHGGSVEGNPVVAHMEKNWGNSFPKAWIWAEGVDPATDISFAFSGGLVTFMVLDIKAQLSGYRNPNKDINCSFHPGNSFHDLKYDGCEGTASLRVESIECSVIFEVSAPPKSFSSCLPAPMAVGFNRGCVESFNAVANITVYQREGLSMVMADSQIIQNAALEFGMEYMCNGHCPSE